LLASLKLSKPLTSLDLSYQNSILSSLKFISILGGAGYSGHMSGYSGHPDIYRGRVGQNRFYLLFFTSTAPHLLSTAFQSPKGRFPPPFPIRFANRLRECILSSGISGERFGFGVSRVFLFIKVFKLQIARSLNVVVKTRYPLGYYRSSCAAACAPNFIQIPWSNL
jgi:hypothetical protein